MATVVELSAFHLCSCPSPLKEPKEAFLCTVDGLLPAVCGGSFVEGGWERGTAQKGDGARSRVREGVGVCGHVSLCACLGLSEPVVSVRVDASVSPRESMPSLQTGRDPRLGVQGEAQTQKALPARRTGPRAGARCQGL